MDKNITILIYEKEKHLNSILHQQILDTNDFELYSVSEYKNLLELVNKKRIDVCILNFEDMNNIYTKFFDNILTKNPYLDIIGYCDKSFNNSTINNLNITLLEKPFRFRTLLEKLEYIKLTKIRRNKIILIKHIEFFPYKKILFNSKTKITIHLTEKENYLLNYLFNKKNEQLTKNDILTNIWGIAEGINTHTLETHVYRLKQKLFKLDPQLCFSLINQKGLYTFQFNKIS